MPPVRAAQRAIAEKVVDIAALEATLVRARAADTSYVIVVDADPRPSTLCGGH